MPHPVSILIGLLDPVTKTKTFNFAQVGGNRDKQKEERKIQKNKDKKVSNKKHCSHLVPIPNLRTARLSRSRKKKTAFTLSPSPTCPSLSTLFFCFFFFVSCSIVVFVCLSRVFVRSDHPCRHVLCLPRNSPCTFGGVYWRRVFSADKTNQRERDTMFSTR